MQAGTSDDALTVKLPLSSRYDDPETTLTVTVDPELVEAGNRAVANGVADSLSAWVNNALADKVRRDQQLLQLGAAIAGYEAEFGEITAAEMATQRPR